MIEHSFTLFKKLSKHALFKVKIHLAWTLYKVKSLVFFSKPTAMNTLERVGIWILSLYQAMASGTPLITNFVISDAENDLIHLIGLVFFVRLN